MDSPFVCMPSDYHNARVMMLQVENERLTAELEKYKQMENRSQDLEKYKQLENRDKPILYNERDYETMKKTIYGHASNEPKDAQMGVAFVILNRAKSRKESGVTIDEICRESGQFWIGLHGEPEIEDCDVYNSFDEWLPRLIKGEIEDLTNGAQFFLNYWHLYHAFLNDVEHVATHGSFKFYK